MGSPVLAGIGYVKIREHWDRDYLDLAFKAIKDILDNYSVDGVDALYVGNALSSFYGRQMAIATHIADQLGLFDAVVSTFSSGGASSAQAIYNAILGIESGIYKAVIAGGVEKMSEELPAKVVRGVSLVENSFYVDYMGVTEFSIHALAAQMYMDSYGLDRRSISLLPVMEHGNASKASHVQFRNKISLDMVVNAPPVAEPLTIFDVSAPGDGAAFILLMDEELAKKAGLEYIRILGMGSASQPVNLLDRPSPIMFEATSRAVEKALKISKLNLEDINHMEIYNPSSISGLLILDAIGMNRRGESYKKVEEGFYSLDGRCPINTFGGAKARGDPKGAVTAYQFVETYLQHMGMANNNQVGEVNYSLIHSMVGFDNSSYVFIVGGGKK